MKIDKSIFKAYDIRGIYPEQVNEEMAYKLGQAFVVMLKKEVDQDKLRVVVGQDMRLSSPQLTEKLIQGITSQGADVIDIGLASTPTFYFGVSHLGADAGIVVSASHNPPEYNGFKMTRRQAVPISGETGIMSLRDMVANEEFTEVENKGAVSKEEHLLSQHIALAMTYAIPDKIKPFKVVVDAANAMGGLMFRKLFEKLPCELIELNFDLDGTFPAHEADPLKDENNKQLQDKVLEVGADLGIALDGDADRIFFVDDKGVTVEPAIVRGILSQIFLKDNSGATICYDVRPGKITEDMIMESGGVPCVTKVGHSLIKEKAREVGAVYAGESSGHFFLKTNLGVFEMPMVMALEMLKKLSEVDMEFSEYIKPLQKYFHSGEINFAVEDKDAVFKRLRENYSDNLKYDFDGLSFEWDEWWFNVRASNTENKVRLNLEARSQDVMEAKRDEVSKVLVGN